MVKLLLTWPRAEQPFLLDEQDTFDRAVSFDSGRGVFSHSFSPESKVNVLFYWTVSGPAISNYSQDHICIINGVALAQGQRALLHYGSKLQIGNFKLTVSEEGTDITDDPFAKLISDTVINTPTNEKDIETILPQGAYYLADEHYLNEIRETVHENVDILKLLELEYKKFLVWGELKRDNFTGQERKIVSMIQNDTCFDAVREQMKSKTLTECIFETSALMSRVWKELDNVQTFDDALYKEEKYDILKLLAPEDIVPRTKKIVPSIVFLDLYQIDLDSYLNLPELRN